MTDGYRPKPSPLPKSPPQGTHGVSSKIKIKIDDPKTRAIWTAVQHAKAEVASWPPSKRGEDGPSPVPPPPDVRSWEPVGDKRWVLCVGFGPDTYRRPMLVVDDRGAQLRWAISQVEHVPGKGRVETWGRDVDIAELEGSLTPIEAMRWGLDELAAIARDRSQRYTQQLHTLMIERVRLGVDGG